MNKLLVTTLESRFRVYDLRTQVRPSRRPGRAAPPPPTATLPSPQHPSEGFAHVSEKAHKSTVWMGRHLPQNRELFVTTGGNGGINVYKYHYPEDGRVAKDADGVPRGVAGRAELLNARVVSSQPLVAWDWSPDKEGLAVAAALDQTLRVFIVTKLNKY